MMDHAIVGAAAASNVATTASAAAAVHLDSTSHDNQGLQLLAVSSPRLAPAHELHDAFRGSASSRDCQLVAAAPPHATAHDRHTLHTSSWPSISSGHMPESNSAATTSSRSHQAEAGSSPPFSSSSAAAGAGGAAAATMILPGGLHHQDDATARTSTKRAASRDSPQNSRRDHEGHYDGTHHAPTSSTSLMQAAGFNSAIMGTAMTAFSGGSPPGGRRSSSSMMPAGGGGGGGGGSASLGMGGGGAGGGGLGAGRSLAAGSREVGESLSRSESEGEGMMSGGEEEGDAVERPAKKTRAKRYHRHTSFQIQEMERLFKECPHPDEKQRQELSSRLRLEPRQVKFWFQNRRTQMKAQSERAENSILRADNDRLRSELFRLREAFSLASCPKCGGGLSVTSAAGGGHAAAISDQQQQQLAMEATRLAEENVRLKMHIERMNLFAAQQLSLGQQPQPDGELDHVSAAAAAASAHGLMKSAGTTAAAAAAAATAAAASSAAALAAAGMNLGMSPAGRLSIPGALGGGGGLQHGLHNSKAGIGSSANRINVAAMSEMIPNMPHDPVAAASSHHRMFSSPPAGLAGQLPKKSLSDGEEGVELPAGRIGAADDGAASTRLGAGGGGGGGGGRVAGGGGGGRFGFGDLGIQRPAGVTSAPPLVADLLGGGGAGVGAAAPSLFDLGNMLSMGMSGLSDGEAELVMELAVCSMEELVQMAQVNEPLWLPPANTTSNAAGGASHDSMPPAGASSATAARQRDGTSGGGGSQLHAFGRERLDRDEYRRRFPNKVGDGPASLSREASRASGVVLMSAASLAEILLDPVKWTELFPCIISRAVTVDVVAAGMGPLGLDGTLQLMYAELQMLTPLVSTREMFFLRFCKQIAATLWVVADVSVDSLRSDPPSVMLRCRRRPSGYVLQDLPNGMCRVSIVEHCEVDNSSVPPMMRPVMNSNVAFGAARWLTLLHSQCLRMVALISPPTSRDSGFVSQQGRGSLVRLASRMISNFCLGCCATTQHSWKSLSASAGAAGGGGSMAEDIRVMTRKSVETPGEPQGIILSAATSIWLPVRPTEMFDFLRSERMRCEWDILTTGGEVSEMGRVVLGQESTDCVQLLKVQAHQSGHSNMLILQETSSSLSGSLIVYAPVDIPAMQSVITGGDPDRVALLPSGFHILPDCATSAERAAMLHALEGGKSSEVDSLVAQSRALARQEGCILTVAFQLLVSSAPTARLTMESVETVNGLILGTIDRIKTMVFASLNY